MVNETDEESAEPGLFVTRVAEPAWAISEAGMEAVRCEESTNLVVRSAPFHVKTAPGTKLDPVMLNVKLPVPCVALGGVTDVKLGVGLAENHCGRTNGPRSST